MPGSARQRGIGFGVVISLSVALSVQDSGPGRNPENATHVFDPFLQRSLPGWDRGFSFSQRIIEDSGGELRLTKTGSSGCTFEIALPSVATSDRGVVCHDG
jgi:C4-dicarboxylate-specific signal transduction histidine kinase